MKLLAKFGLVALFGGVGATVLYARPSGAEGVAEVDVVYERVLVDVHRVQQLQQVAHTEKDVLKLNCVNDKLVQLKPQVNMAEQAKLQAHLTDLEALAVSIHALREAAEACIGKLGLTSEGTSNSFTKPDGAYDPAGMNPWGATFEPAGYASIITPAP